MQHIADLIDHHKETKGRPARTQTVYEGKGRGPCELFSALPLGRIGPCDRATSDSHDGIDLDVSIRCRSLAQQEMGTGKEGDVNALHAFMTCLVMIY